MTLFVNLRSMASLEPDVLDVDPGVTPPKARLIRPAQLAQMAAGRDVLFAVHGFNVSYAGGIASLGRLGQVAQLPPDALFIGVLWPGDFWIPVVNYPFEASDAVRCGKLLAAFSDRWLASAHSLSFMSHSLGGRLVLEAVRHSARKIAMMCLTAAAVDRDCLTAQYAGAVENCDATYVLSSRKDRVLRYAYPAGDFLSDLFGDPDSPFRTALGLHGPSPAAGQSVRPKRIPPDPPCDHGDYLADNEIGRHVAGYVSRAFRGAPQTWP